MEIIQMIKHRGKTPQLVKVRNLGFSAIPAIFQAYNGGQSIYIIRENKEKTDRYRKELKSTKDNYTK